MSAIDPKRLTRLDMIAWLGSSKVNRAASLCAEHCAKNAISLEIDEPKEQYRETNQTNEISDCNDSFRACSICEHLLIT